MIRRVAMLALALSTAAGARVPPSGWAGVWDGSIGPAHVRMCLQNNDYGGRGLYFYHSHLTLIGLNNATATPRQTPPLHSASRWFEGPDSARTTGPWIELAPAAGNHITGVWLARPKSGPEKRLPVSLTRLPLGGDDDIGGECGTFAFVAPLAPPPHPSTSPSTYEGARIVKITIDPGKALRKDVLVENFNLIGTTPGIARINAALNAKLPTQAKGSEYLDCIQGALGSFGGGGDYSDLTKPVMITRHWMSTEQDNGYSCGGAHPDNSSLYRLWNLDSGKQVQLWRWFSTAAVIIAPPERGAPTDYNDAKIAPRFRQRLMKRWPVADNDTECRDVVAEAAYWNVYLTRKGVMFEPQLPHVVTGCVDTVTLPYAHIMPFLNAEGRAGVASVVVDLKAR